MTGILNQKPSFVVLQTTLLLWVLVVPPICSLLKIPPLSLLGRWAHLGLFVWPALIVVHILSATTGEEEDGQKGQA